MPVREKTCTVGGPRPHKLPAGLDISRLQERLDGEMRVSIFRGYTRFLSGMSLGVDIWAAEAILKLKKEFPHIRLVCYLPCETQADHWPNFWRNKYFNVLAEADDVITQQTHYTPDCIIRRNLSMIDDSSRLIVVHDGISPGGTEQTVGYAQAKGIEVVNIDPEECLFALREVK